MSKRKRCIWFCLTTALLLLFTVGANAQGIDYAQTLYAPLLTASSGGDIGIAQQRQNRMIVGRSGDLDVPARGEVAVDRQHASEGFFLFARHSSWLRKSKKSVTWC